MSDLRPVRLSVVNSLPCRHINAVLLLPFELLTVDSSNRVESSSSSSQMGLELRTEKSTTGQVISLV
ncbi:hypothetical protein VTL71DRAFT_16297 [Oculimacula yallundae]|uniref:Uncharacterized protein n=1 Tax=Oculimacula yallundae TaxID=86028 RepID=A0ABR4CE19_9HELO